jgi:serine/threonine protein kinase
MISESSPSNDSETLFTEFIHTLMAADDPGGVIDDFTQRFPQHADEFRELAQLNRALDVNQKPILPPPPSHLGEFRITRLLNFGGMGEIYEAYHQRLDRRVALKIVRRGWSSTEARERFIREQQVLANLHHSHIVPIHSGGEEGLIQYFTMPYINGASLNHVVATLANLSTCASSSVTPRLSEIVDKVVKQSDSFGSKSTVAYHDSAFANNGTIGKLSNDNHTKTPKGLKLSRDYFVSVAKTMAEVAEAVEYAHQAGVLHRDLKPANVMVEPNGHAWVIDFGLAAARQHDGNANPAGSRKHTTAPSALLLTQGRGGGTFNYMAPERWLGLPADKLSDVFSLGTTLYELLTLQRAFEGDSAEEIEANVLSATPLSARRLVRSLPVDLEAIATKAMEKDPAFRYQSAAALADDLHHWLRNEPTTARPAWIPRRLWLWAWRKPAIAASVSVIFLSLVVIATIGQVAEIRGEKLIQQLQYQLLSERREKLIQQLQSQLLTEHRAGWSDEAWGQVRTISKQKLSDELRDFAANSLVGIDARTSKSFEFSPSELIYDQSGRRLLMVEYIPEEMREPGSPRPQTVQVWDSESDDLRNLPQRPHDGCGAITYRGDGVPLQLVWNKNDANVVILWDMIQQKEVRRLACPYPLQVAPAAWSMTPGGKVASVLALNPEGKRQLLVWETETGNQLANLSTLATRIELSPDGSLVAAAAANGNIEIWSVARRELTTTLSAGHAEILCMAWTKDYLRPADGGDPGWLLAAGAAGGDLTIWDTQKHTARSFCVGSQHDVNRIAFSPDGMTLVSTASRSRAWPRRRPLS